ncbi:MAG: hypothetical protein E5Y06_10590 [Mesorhizobium sp.]|uniref:tape measure protein n=1 Tax=Mesorhizobium sp. TaxID=1871066 RepID=UPI0011FFF3B1|nr:tape measure protein [Mesorhizobium sp.]TIN95695.1 MAG: hypothetical protein E5Y06_10590 [Mesorhizobium sp.]TJU98486.1 MAG: hypothetical protein E5Y08_13430 [Mesorhizobium sp.]
MSDYQIKIAVDGSAAERGVKQFTGSLTDAMKALKAFDQRSRSTFDGLKKLTSLDSGGLSRSLRGTAQAIEVLNRVKLSKSLVNNLQMLQRTLAGFRFNADALKRVPEAMAALSRVRIDGRVITQLQMLKAAMVGWKSPPAAAVRNLSALASSLNTVNPAKITAAAAALQRLNGLSLKVGRGSLPDFSKTTSSLKGLSAQMAATSSVANLFRSALAGISAVALARGVYQTGSAFMNLERTLGSVASSSGEVKAQMGFLQSLTQRMPVSLDAVASSYGQFATAARLSGVSVADTQKVFEGFSTAFAAMGVGTEQQKNGFLALTQMMSKGKISAEELRQQLAEALPGATQILADSLGVSTAKLQKMMQAGAVGSDALIKMADRLQSQFGPAVAAAMNSSQAQIVAFQNAWTNLQKIIFNSGFNAGLGALARQVADAMNSDPVKKFAGDIGNYLGQAFRVIGATVRILSDNTATVSMFFKAFAGYAVVAAAAGAFRLLLLPLGLLAPLVNGAAAAFGALKTALVFIATGKAFSAIADIGKAFAGLTGKIMLAVGAVTLFAAGLDAVFNNSRATKALIDGVGSVFQALSDKLVGFGAGLGDGVTKAFASAMKQTDDYAKAIQDANLLNDNLLTANAAREAANSAAKLSALTDEQQKVWDQVNGVGKANDEYKKQLVLLDAIAAKKGIDATPYKKVLESQSLDKRNPVGALVRDYQQELNAATARTGYEKAVNAAVAARNDLLKQGINLTNAQAQALTDYQVGLAKMNGDIGNGIERWSAKVGDFNDNMQSAIADGIGGLSDEISKFVTGADADFAGLARSILASFVKLSLDSMLKDMFGAMGQDGQKNGQSQAEGALAKLANIGETITTAMTNVYTSGLTVNGLPIGSGSLANSPELAGNQERLRRAVEAVSPTPAITRSALPDIPDTNVGGRLSDANARIPIEGSAAGLGLRGSLGAKGAFAPPADLGLRGTIAPAAANANTLDIGSVSSILGAKGNRSAFVNAFYGAGMNAGLNDTQARLMAAQAGHESGNGMHAPGFNYFGIKAGKSWTGDTQRLWTHEEVNGKNVRVQDDFRKYANPEEAIRDRMAFMERAYPKANHATDIDSAIADLRNGRFGSYATDSGYAKKLQPYLNDINGDLIKQVGRPKETVPAGIDPTTTQSIDALNAKMSSIGQAAQAASLPLDQFRAANQNLATASTLAGTNVASAGTMASTAGPQFQTAGQALASAGQSAATAGQTAQTATAGVGGFGSGISQLLGPLASAIPGLGQFGGMIMQLASSLLSGGGMGGGLLGGLFSEGGYANSPVARAALPISAWAGAPHFAEGTANTSGGMPAVLHDNEAVIPLSRGRKIPVELGNDNRNPMHGAGAGRGRGGAPTNNFIFNGVKDADSFRQSKQQIQSQMLGAMHRSAMRNG